MSKHVKLNATARLLATQVRATKPVQSEIKPAVDVAKELKPGTVDTAGSPGYHKN